MKVKTNLYSGGAIQEAQDQAEFFFKRTDELLQDGSQKIGQAVGVAADKIGRIWRCAFVA